MAKVYKKREYINYPSAPPIQETAKVERMEWKRGNSMIFHTPDFEPFEATIDSLQQNWVDGIVYLKFHADLASSLAWITLSIYPKMSFVSRCYLAHNDLRLHFPFPRPGKSRHRFDIVNYDNVIVTENEAKVSGVKVEILQSVAEKKVFNPVQLKLFQ